MRLLLLLAGVMLSVLAARAEDSTECWRGVRSYDGKSDALVVHVERSAGAESGTVDLPEFGALGIPASRFSRTGDRFHFELVGDETTTVFDGRVAADVAKGTWLDGTRSGDFHLRLGPAIAPARQKEIAFQSGSVRLAGTLVLPAADARAPAIVFVHGAGAETRNASRFLAQFLAERGIASLIYDKRGAGESTGDWRHASFEDLTQDVVAAVGCLKARPEVDAGHLGLMGTSQGGWLAPMATARSSDVRFVILKSAAGVSPEEQELARVEMGMRASGEASAEIAQAQALYRQVISYARTGKGWESLAAALAAARGKKWNVFGDVTRDWWFLDSIRLYYGHDPLPPLAAMTAPVLVIFGGKDVDVPVQRSLERMIPVLGKGGRSAVIQIFPEAGHDLRVERAAGEPWDFPRLAPGYLDLLDAWVQLQVHPPRQGP
jgi:pimeloyl-ACP methyl ester carboxylesterase